MTVRVDDGNGGSAQQSYTLKVQVPQAPTAALRWLDFGDDRVGPGGVVNPDGQGDGHFSVTLDLPSPKTVEE